MASASFVSSASFLSHTSSTNHLLHHCPFAGRKHAPVRPYRCLPPSSLGTVHMLASKESATPSAQSTESLKTRLCEALKGLNYGLSIDADSETTDDQESEVEDLIEQIENLNDCPNPTQDPRMDGVWDLLYTSSNISRYFGGLTGIQRYLPDGSVEAITQTLDVEDGTCTLTEKIEFDVPFVDKRASVDAIVTGKLRAINDIRLSWNAENVQVSFFKWFADGWKTVRALKVTDTTYLDDDFRIIRGQTGSVCVFAKQRGLDD